MKAGRLLLIEDDEDLTRILTLNLKDEGYEVDSVGEGEQGYEKAVKGDYDLIVLDLILPGMDGLEICRRLRTEAGYASTPILILTARSSELDRVLGLELGADDYLVKPFSMKEFLARVRAILRRIDAIPSRSSDPEESLIRRGELTIDVSKHEAILGTETLDLTAREFELLLKLAANPGRVLTRRQLLDSVWGYGFQGYEHTVNSHINRLRKKLEPTPEEPRYILTVWGVGYKFSDQHNVLPASPTSDDSKPSP